MIIIIIIITTTTIIICYEWVNVNVIITTTIKCNIKKYCNMSISLPAKSKAPLNIVGLVTAIIVGGKRTAAYKDKSLFFLSGNTSE